MKRPIHNTSIALARHITSIALASLLAAPALSQENDADTAAEKPWGHSSHGAAYDEGPRQKPWLMDGIGSTPSTPRIETGRRRMR